MGIPAHGFLAPGKRARFAAVVFVLAVIAASLTWVRLPDSQESKTSIAGEKSRPTSDAQEQTGDRDNDGLSDWEEALWKTDAGNPDSDGDGTLDGEETRIGRDPLKAGPNDVTSAATAALRGVGTVPSAPISRNLTEDLVASVLQSGVLAEIEQGGDATAPEVLKRIAFPDNIDPEKLLAEAATASARDFTLLQTNDPAAIRNYFLGVSRMYERSYVPAVAARRESDVEILAAAIRTEDYTRLTELDPLIALLARLADEFRRIPVPEPYRDFAIKELNYIFQTKRALEIFRNAPQDPIAAALAVGRRAELLEEMGQFHETTNRALEAEGITL